MFASSVMPLLHWRGSMRPPCEAMPLIRAARYWRTSPVLHSTAYAASGKYCCTQLSHL
jgi:hypothetical protein